MPFVRVTSGLTNVCKTYFRLFACCTTFPEFNFTRLLETWKLIVQTGSYFCNPPIGYILTQKSQFVYLKSIFQISSAVLRAAFASWHPPVCSCLIYWSGIALPATPRQRTAWCISSLRLLGTKTLEPRRNTPTGFVSHYLAEFSVITESIEESAPYSFSRMKFYRHLSPDKGHS